ncbi:DUF4235 domain-containing protein [Streptomyces adonidis]|uniref:DUF4235 domain-containing protein n=1 Tax=Streptomyces adonidis TaxID=3231367 RepID=UPI0034DAF563
MAMGALDGGVRAYALVEKTGHRLAHEEYAPDSTGSTGEHCGRREVRPAAVLKGAILAGVKAAVDRGGATAVRSLTGTWPG